MNSKAFVVSALTIIVASVFLFGSCKKESVSASITVSGFSPSSGPAGTVVIITGSNFNTIVSNNSVSFNGTPATVSAASAGQITAVCPSGASSGKISVTSGGSSATSSGTFTVTQ